MQGETNSSEPLKFAGEMLQKHDLVDATTPGLLEVRPICTAVDGFQGTVTGGSSCGSRNSGPGRCWRLFTIALLTSLGFPFVL